MNIFSKIGVIGSALLVLSSASAIATMPVETDMHTPATKVSDTTLENFYQVDKDLYRSGQPGVEQMQELERRGVKSIFNLRNFHTDNSEAKGTSLKLYHIPMEAGRFTEEQVILALKQLYHAPKPALIHCWHGSDRTGLMVAMYRMVFLGWSKQDAIEELKKPEFGYHKWAYYNIIQYLENVDVESIRKQVTGTAGIEQ
ncbi:dual specificity protein phosphatase family protein [Limnobaculum zhutongyuii]|nr:dual specificity protein phosphatase family protein [Limnobaculum zhutongyuii]